MTHPLVDLVRARSRGEYESLTAVCSSHPLVLRAALRAGARTGRRVLIEATCNQVNHEGGYTGMQPQDFINQVHELARSEGFDINRLVLGGDHLGPNPWRYLPADQAMAQAETMVAGFAAAGYQKFHLDASMRCKDDPEQLSEQEIATRAARLAKVIEATAKPQGTPQPVYVIGTEVPPPGGANHVLDTVLPTEPEAALATIAMHRKIFSDRGLDDAFGRVIALVVQPGVEFGDSNVYNYQPALANRLRDVLNTEPTLGFEAHSTDYQPSLALQHLEQDGYCILKVGPWLSFAMREALYALDTIAGLLNKAYPSGALKSAMEELMIAKPEYWKDHYSGTDDEVHLKRHFSYSDRIRYYWNTAEATAAVDRLMNSLVGITIPETLVSQYLPAQWRYAMQGDLRAEDFVLNAVEQALNHYPAEKKRTTAP